jgi:hypothetical protein
MAEHLLSEQAAGEKSSCKPSQPVIIIKNQSGASIL